MGATRNLGTDGALRGKAREAETWAKEVARKHVDLLHVSLVQEASLLWSNQSRQPQELLNHQPQRPGTGVTLS